MGRRIFVLGVVIILTLLALLPRSGHGSHVDPIFVGYNARCSDLAPAGVDWQQMEIDPVRDGTYSNGPLTVNLDVHGDDDRATIDWSSSVPLDGVFVKGGPGGNFYHYDPPASGDATLSTPINPHNDRPYSPSHLLFCAEAPLSTATATPPPAVSATPSPSGTATPTPSVSATYTPSPSPTTVLSATPTLTPSPTETTVPGTVTPGPTVTASPTAPPNATATPGPSATPLPDPFSRVYFPAICVGCLASPGEPNNSCPTAYPLQPDTPYELFLPDDQHDWYRFELSAPAEVEVRLQNFVPLDGQLAAYSGDSCESARFLQNFGQPAQEKVLLLAQQPAGVFFLYVSNDGDFSDDDPYRLVVETR